MKKNLIIVLLFLTLAGVSVWLLKDTLFPEKEVHYHAGFQIYIDGKKQDFSSYKFMDLQPCGGEEKHDAKTEQNEKGHLHDGVGDVVHVHRENSYWRDLLINLRISTKDKPVEGVINGKQVSDILNQPTRPYESVIIFLGTHNDIKNYIKDMVPESYIREVEKQKESCGKDK